MGSSILQIFRYLFVGRTFTEQYVRHADIFKSFTRERSTGM